MSATEFISISKGVATPEMHFSAHAVKIVHVCSQLCRRKGVSVHAYAAAHVYGYLRVRGRVCGYQKTAQLILQVWFTLKQGAALKQPLAAPHQVGWAGQGSPGII